MLSIQTNVNSMNAQENLRVTNQFQGRTIARLTSGYRINESGDDAAGLAVANKYRSDVTELVQGVRNANDGLSTLQIIDGGLNNISKMLDRMKTLATQSASETFTGDRKTLNKEYQDLLTEVNRQADMVGLGVGNSGGRNNTDIDVYVGGKQQGSPKVTIELSGNANRVDAIGLKLAGTSIAAGSSKLANSADLRTKTDFLSSNATQAFSVNVSKSGSAAQTIAVIVTGDEDGLTGSEIVGQLNAKLSEHGVTAGINAVDGKLQFSGDTAFTVNVAADTSDVMTSTDSVMNTSLYRASGDATYDPITASTREDITFVVGDVSRTIQLTNTDDINAALTKINDEMDALGVRAVKTADGGNIAFMSSAKFSVSSANVNAGAAPVATDGIFNAAGSSTVTGPAADSSATAAAEASIGAVQKAVSALGLVQGKIGTAQNKLGYAIQLAQSQITSFSAAESRIRDADVAQEAANLTKAQVLQQASLAALGQANSAPQAVLSLLRG